jgi:hypothetical protein
MVRSGSGSNEAFVQRTQPPSASEEGYEASRSIGFVTFLDEYYGDGNE